MRATHLHQAPRAALAGLIALAVTLALALPVPPSSASDTAREWREWIVPANAELSHGMEVVEELALVGANIVRSAAPPAGGIPADTALTWRSEGVTGDDSPLGFEAPDVELPDRGNGPADRPTSSDGGADATESDPTPAGEFGEPTDAVVTTGAPDEWATTTGEQALVALIDTGVAGDVDALDGAIAGEVSFTEDGGGDGHGHGTYMASLIAGAHERVTGTAPDAGIVSLKVGDDDGSTDLGTVLAALEWLHGPGRDLGIRVATLALGVDPEDDAGVLLDIATQRLAAHGMLIVTAAGNDGPDQGPSSPATSPGTLAVGALTADGAVAEFSARGVDRAGNQVPDLYAPGEKVLGYNARGSVIHELAKRAAEDAGDEERLERLEDGFLQGTGTSASTALATGVAALVASANPAFSGLDITEALLDGRGDGSHLSAAGALAAATYIEGTEPTELAGPGNSGNAGPPEQPGRPDHAGKPDHAGGPDREYAPVPIPPVADWTPAQWNDDRWVAGDWAAERWSGPPAGHPANVTPQIFSWRTADWQGGVWDADSWHASTWTPGHWQQLQYEDAWEIFSWRGDEWEIFSWRSDDWDIFSWRNLSTEIFSWRGDDWDIFSWRAEAWTLMIDE